MKRSCLLLAAVLLASPALGQTEGDRRALVHVELGGKGPVTLNSTVEYRPLPAVGVGAGLALGYATGGRITRAVDPARPEQGTEDGRYLDYVWSLPCTCSTWASRAR